MATPTPEYPHTHTGPAFVVGTAPCVTDDLAQARQLYPNAAAIGVNEGVAVTQCDHLFSLHSERLRQWRELAERQWGRVPIVHAANRKRADNIEPSAKAAIDYWWHGVHSGGSSGWSAVRLAHGLGYSPIILCGCPMNGGDGYAVDKTGPPACHQIGEVSADHSMNRRYRSKVAEAVAEGEGKGVYSLSGFTRELLGEPPWPT